MYDDTGYGAKDTGCPDVSLLHCILNYPTSNENAHLLMIKGLINSFPDYIIGYSDHTLPDPSMTSLITAHLLGAVIIEKHFTHDKNLSGNDHYHAMNIDDLDYKDYVVQNPKFLRPEELPYLKGDSTKIRT